ncbi:shikimate kinase [Latilactobacillus fuchuensis]|uniref:shikimate kinase n=1 Tax=Latilactobacillus fuchuensis TaxID=164393 RepID=UPI000AF8FA5E|nr:shikimate kinase [Latilactobacillus fuchuensis]
MQLILIGFMGSGKTTIARKVAHYFKSQWVDLDRYIIEEQQMSINDIFALKGQSAFREMEFNALQQLIKQDGVIATGGGIVDNAQTRYLLQQSGIPVFYLNGTYEATGAESHAMIDDHWSTR